MAKDQIMFTKEWTKVKAELEKDEGYFELTHTPFMHTGEFAVSLIRGSVPTDPLVEMLGDYSEVFSDPVKDAKYKSAYPYDVPIDYVDEEGKPQQYMRPKRIGEFA